jgi:hypothetical protein
LFNRRLRSLAILSPRPLVGFGWRQAFGFKSVNFADLVEGGTGFFAALSRVPKTRAHEIIRTAMGLPPTRLAGRAPRSRLRPKPEAAERSVASERAEIARAISVEPSEELVRVVSDRLCSVRATRIADSACSPAEIASAQWRVDALGAAMSPLRDRINAAASGEPNARPA